LSSGLLSAEEGVLAAVATGPGGRSRAGDAVLDISLADAGLMIGADRIQIHPGFPGGLPNDPPVASAGYGTRIIGFGLRLPATAASHRGTDADGDRLRVVAVDAVSEHGARVELDGEQIRYRPPEGLDTADSFGFILADSYGDTAAARFQVLVISNPNPVDPETDRIRSRVDDAGRVELRFAAVPGQLYQVQSATNIVPPIRWETLAEVRAATDGRVVFSGAAIPVEPVRYYRLVP
jgi:subtilisin family serine protease